MADDGSDSFIPINFEAANLDHGDCCSKPGKYMTVSLPTNTSCSAASSNKGCGRADCCQLPGDPEPAPSKFPRFKLKPYKIGTELIYPPALNKQIFSPLKFGSSSRQWLRPTTLDQLLAIKARHPDAKLVGGSSEIQIEVKLKAAVYPVSVFVSDIPELHGVWPPTSNRRTFEFGANISLAELEVTCKRLCAELDPRISGPIDAVRTQLRYFAGLQIRNVATVGGNIATASPISDLNPVWVATGAKVVAASPGKKQFELPLAEFFTGYRKTTLPRDAVIVKIIVPLNVSGDREVVRAYKQVCFF